jgi:hypothetical protein
MLRLPDRPLRFFVRPRDATCKLISKPMHDALILYYIAMLAKIACIPTETLKTAHRCTDSKSLILVLPVHAAQAIVETAVDAVTDRYRHEFA